MPSPGRVAIVGAVVFSCLAGDAGAETPRYRRDPKLKVDVHLTERTRPKARPAPATADRPRVSPEELLAHEGEVRDLRLEQIRLLDELVADTPDDAPIEKADLVFRAADSYGQLSRYHRLEGVAAQIAADGAKAPAEKKRQLGVARQHGKDAQAARREALARYQTLVATGAYRPYPGMHAALFAYAFTLQQGTPAERTRSREIYHRLLTEYPSSKFVPHAYLAFADYFFEENQLASAEGFYGKVLAFPKSNVYHYARYMRGWVYVNQGRHEDAGREFLTVLRETEGKADQDELRRAARNDFVRAFSEFGDVHKGWQAFAKIDAAAAPAMFERLADLYVEQGKTDRAVFALRQLIKEAPRNPHVCAWQHDIAVSMLTTPGASATAKVEEIERLVKLEGALARTKTLPPADAADCHDNAAAMSGEMARLYHSEADKTQDMAAAANALRLYDAYLAGFPDAADFGETQYYRAELGWMRATRELDARKAVAMWEDTARAFTAVVKSKRVTGALLEESAAAAVDGWRNALAVDPRPRLTPVAYKAGAAAGATRLPAPQPVPATEQAMLGAVDDYLTFITDPKNPLRVDMKFLKANTLRRFDRLEEALPAFEDIVLHHADHETALYAANIVFDIHILAGRHDRIADWGRWFGAHPGFYTARAGQDRGDLEERVGDVNRIAARLDAQDKEAQARKKKDLAGFVACGNAYLTLFNAEVKRDPDAGLAEGLDEMLYNAGVCFEDGRSLSAAIDVYTQLRERFPTSKSSAHALARLGNVYARVAFYDRASENFEAYAKTYAGEGDAFQAMNDAVVFRRGIGDDAAAIADTRYFIKKFGKGKQVAAAADAFFSLGSIHEKRGELDEVVAHYRKYLSTYGDKGGGERMVMAYARIGEILWQQSCPVKTVDGACVKVTRERAVGRAARKRARGDATRTQCGPETKMKLTVIRRDPKKVAAALAAFGQAIAEYERRGGSFPVDPRQARHAYALATFHRAEVEYEKFLAVSFPTGLDFDPARPAAKKASDQKLAAWFKQKDTLATAAGAGYSRLFKEIKDPATAVMGAARLAQIAQVFSDTLYTAEVPVFIRPYEEAVDLYCGRLEEIAAPYEASSLEGFTTCLDFSSKAGWFSSWSRVCERELGQIKPEAYPTVAELRAEPDAIAAVADVERAIVAID
jgi:tetratricopeptide (TPR) repeat protein